MSELATVASAVNTVNLSIAEKAALIEKLSSEIMAELSPVGFKQYLCAQIIHNAKMLSGDEPAPYKKAKKGKV